MHRFPDAVIIHQGDALHPVPVRLQHRERNAADRQRDQAVRDARGAVELFHPARREGAVQLGRARRLDAPDRRGALRRLESHHYARDQAAAPHRHHHRGHVGEIFHDLERDGGLAGHHVLVLEGRHHRQALPRGDLLGFHPPVFGGLAREDDFAAPFLHALDFHRGRGLRHHDHGAHAELLRRPGDRLAVVAGGKGDHAAAARGLGEFADGVVGPAGLEGADGLAILELQVGRDLLHPLEGRAFHHAREGLPGFEDVGRRDHFFLAPALGPPVAPLGAGFSVLPFLAGAGAASSPSSSSPFSVSSSFTTRATSTTMSPGVRFITFTPWVLRPEIRIPSTGTRIMIPFLVIIISSSSGGTSFRATMSPVFSLRFRVMIPRPPRCWMRYSSSSERLPIPFAATTSRVEARFTTTMSITWSFLSSSIPFTPVAARPMSRTSCSWNRMLIPCRVAMTMSFRPSVTCTSISSSPFSMLMALMPVERGFPKAESTVFFTTPSLVAKKRNC